MSSNSSYHSVPPSPPSAGYPPLHAAGYRDNNDDDDDNTSEASDPRYRPHAAPPVGAPPTPPPTPPSWYYASQVAVATTTTNPNIKMDYGTESSQSNGAGSARNAFQGDASLRPNIGLTNSYEYALFGWTLQELVVNLRTLNLVATTLTLLWCMASWFIQLVTFQISNVVLLCYLAVLSLALLLVDIMGFYRTQLSERGIATTTNNNSSVHTFVMEERVRDQLGLLYHPGGKAFYLFFLTVLCGSLGSLWLRLIGLLYGCSAIGYVYAYNMYPEFRRGDVVLPNHQAASSDHANGAPTLWTKQAWTSTSLPGRGLAEAAARNWSSRWGLQTGPEEPSETDSFLRHNQASSTYVNV